MYREWYSPAYIRVFRQIKGNDIHWCAFFPVVLVSYDGFWQYLFEKGRVISDKCNGGK